MEEKAKVKPERRVGGKAWREKSWYEIIAPSMFGGAKVGETPTLNPDQLVGRVFETSLGDLIEDFSKSYVKLRFQVRGVEGNRALTDFVGHDMAQDFIRSQVRRRASKICDIFPVTTKDGRALRLTSIVITFRRIPNSTIELIRSDMRRIVDTRARERTFDQFVQEAVLGKLAADIYKEAKKYCPIKRVEVQKTKVLGAAPQG